MSKPTSEREVERGCVMAYRPGRTDKQAVKDALSEMGYTTGRAGNLDLLDESISLLSGKFDPLAAEGAVDAASNTTGLEVQAEVRNRPVIEIYYSVGGAATILFQDSQDGITWNTIDTFSPSSSEARWEGYNNAKRHLKLSTATIGIDVTFKILAGR